jgi:hypothetical protein
MYLERENKWYICYILAQVFSKREQPVYLLNPRNNLYSCYSLGTTSILAILSEQLLLLLYSRSLSRSLSTGT